MESMFIDDVETKDLWYFPAGFPHCSFKGWRAEGCEFLLVFDQGLTFRRMTPFYSPSSWPTFRQKLFQKNMGWTRQEWDQLPPTELYIFEAELPGPLEDDKRFLGSNLETKNQYTFKMSKMSPTTTNTSGTVRIVDSGNFPASIHITAAQVILKPGAIRELHWHPTVSEWQYWIKGKGRMTIVNAEGKARTMDFNANDVGLVPAMAGHYIENTGDEDLVFLEMFKAPRYLDISLNEWIARMPDKMAEGTH